MTINTIPSLLKSKVAMALLLVLSYSIIIPNAHIKRAYADQENDINECTPYSGIVNPAVADARTWSETVGSVFVSGENDNALGYEESGFLAAAIAAGNNNLSVESPVVTSDTTASWSHGAMTLENVTIPSGNPNVYRFLPISNGEFASGTNLTNDGAVKFNDVNVHPSLSYDIKISFNSGTDINSFSFDLNDLFDGGPIDPSSAQVEILVDGTRTFILSDKTGTTQNNVINNTSIMRHLSNGSGAVIDDSFVAGGDKETTFGIVKNSAISEIIIRMTYVNDGVDSIGIDNFVYAFSDCHASSNNGGNNQGGSSNTTTNNNPKAPDTGFITVASVIIPFFVMSTLILTFYIKKYGTTKQT